MRKQFLISAVSIAAAPLSIFAQTTRSAVDAATLYLRAAWVPAKADQPVATQLWNGD